MTKGQRIRNAREKAHVSQTDFADKIGVSKQTLYKYEHDIVTNIPSNIIELIADLTSCTPAYIMGWDELESFATPEEFEKAWKDRGGVRHPITLTDEEYSFIVDVRAMHDKDFYKRMKMYMDLFAKKDADKGGII
jgi:transcriptional regulator with XRE-family HTH domain